jgi:bifunctional non-homologous end joining protein LigD
MPGPRSEHQRTRDLAASPRPRVMRPATARAARAGLPARVGLQLARLVEAAPPGNDWLHETKFDGYRVLVRRDALKVRITSRGGQDWTARLPDTVRAARRLRARRYILDGELIALDAHRRSSFALLQQCFGEPQSEAQMRVMVFDLLYLDDADLRPLPQIERKRALARLLRHAARPLQLSHYGIGNGAQAARAACQAGLEGVVCKALAAPYHDGRGFAWLKVKCIQSDEFAIIGYTTGKGARARLGALLLASATAAGGWRYRGRVGTGMDESAIDDLLGKLAAPPGTRPAALEKAPSRAQLRGATPRWVSPRLVVEVEFRGYTADGLLRQASLKGLREDRTVASLLPVRRDAAPVRFL